MRNEAMELLKSLKIYLSEGALCTDEFPYQSIRQIIRKAYDDLLEEIGRQFGEYLNIYDTLMGIELEKRGDCCGLAHLLDELISDYEKRRSDYLPDALADLRERRGQAITEFCVQRSKEMYEQYSWKAGTGQTAFEGRGVVYTVITGEYDELQEPMYVDREFDYICFTDNRNLSSKVWSIRFIDNPEGLDRVRLARMHKILCHEYLKEYDFSVYMDGKMQIAGDLRTYIKKYSTGSPMLCFPHPVRKCAYVEAKACAEIGKDDPEKMFNQMKAYEKEGYPADYGLIDSACLVRRHDDKVLQKVMADWWKEVKEKSRRDQLSIGYVCWKHHFHYDLSDLYIYQNEYICKKRSWELPL